MAIELWEVKRFANGSILIDSIKRTASAPLLKPLVKEDSTLDKIISEIRVVTEDDMLSRGTDTTIELYQQFKSALMNLYPEFDLQPKLHYLAFKVGKRNVVDISLLKKTLKIWIDVKHGMLDDPKNLSRNVAEIGKAGNGDYQIEVADDKDLECIMSLAKQAI